MGDWYNNNENKAQSATKLFFRGNNRKPNFNSRKGSEDLNEGYVTPISLSKRFNEAVGDVVTNGAC